MNESVQNINVDLLTPIVRKALSSSTVEITTWQTQAMSGGTGSAIGGTALYRVQGQTVAHGSWSLILKVLYERPGEKEDSPYYWKREYEVYRSGMLSDLPRSGLTPPTIYGVAEFSDTCWVWMEDIQVAERKWTLDDYRIVARRLGRFNGAYLTGRTIPDDPWLADNWHCSITPPLAETFAKLDEHLQYPLVQRTLPAAEKEPILAIWDEVERFCEGLAGLPRTLCHNDVFRRNLFHRAEDTVLIDWALAGRGAIGEDLVVMVALPLYYLGLVMDKAIALETVVFEGYMAGLRDVGWDGDEELARIGYTCAMTLRGLAGVRQDILHILDEANHVALCQNVGKETIEEVADLFADVRRFRLVHMASEARKLLG